MQFWRSVGWLIWKEVVLEWRQRYALGGILLYVLSTMFIVYAALAQIQAQVWNALFWIIVLFAAVNAMVKSFSQEHTNRQLYYYSLVGPIEVFISKVVYNALLMILISFLTYGSLLFIGDNPVKDSTLFSGLLVVGSISFSITLTFVSSLAAKASNSSTLLAILGFPVILPILLLLIRSSAGALRLIQDTSYMNDIYILGGIDLLLLALGIVLFPLIWRQ